MTEATYSQDLQHEYQAEMRKLIGERFLYFCLGVAVIALFQSLTIGWADVVQPLWRYLLRGNAAMTDELAQQIRLPGPEQLLNVAQMVIDSAVYGTAAYMAWRNRLRGRPLDQLAVKLIQVNGAVAMILYAVITRAPGNAIGTVFQAHLVACAFMPWTWRQAVRPMIPLLVLNALLVAGFYGGWFDVRLWVQKIVSVLSSPLIVVPGAVVALVKHTASSQRFKTRFLEARYGQISQELTAARAIHDALFPTSGSTYGPLKLDYRYTPKKQIGGDFLFARAVDGPGGNQLLNLVVLDVTGHGISAALSVSRIHGELERLYGENPAIAPGEVLRSLNRYVELTMATHGIFVTGVVFRISADTDTITFASGGHPPAFVRHQGGSIMQLAAHSTVMGALPDHEFDAMEATCPFVAGDSLVAYTDGAIEATDAHNEQFAIAGVAKALINAPAQAPLTVSVVEAVERFRVGSATDDVLVVEVKRAIRPPAEEPRPAAVSSPAVQL